MTPTVGRIVLYHTYDPFKGKEETRAAIITKVMDERIVNLAVFMDFDTDYKQRVEISRELEVGKWSWPKREGV